jgi:sulfur-oxidizing protein SoxA
MTRGGILASSAAVALIAAGAFVIAGESGASAQAKNKEVPLETKGDASTRPWKRYPGWPTRDESKYNTLGNLATPPAPKQPRKITGPITGDAANGAKLVADRNRGGSCLACHVMGPAGNADLPGNAAPDLSEIGSAGREDEWLFNYIYDARVYNPETVMPPWGSHGFFNDQEINDMVAFLKTLKSPAVFKTVLDDPSKRPAPVEKRENLDPIENPGMWAVDKAQELWNQTGAAGKSCQSCHTDAKEAFKTWAASMPKWEPRLNKVLGVEEFVTRHAKATTGVDWLMETDENRAMSVYLHYLANGKVANHWIRGQWLGEPKGQYDHFPTWRTSLLAIWDIRQRFQWCQVNIRADELPPDAKEYGDLELYLAVQNDGQKLSVPGIRH